MDSPRAPNEQPASSHTPKAASASDYLRHLYRLQEERTTPSAQRMHSASSRLPAASALAYLRYVYRLQDEKMYRLQKERTTPSAQRRDSAVSTPPAASARELPSTPPIAASTKKRQHRQHASHKRGKTVPKASIVPRLNRGRINDDNRRRRLRRVREGGVLKSKVEREAHEARVREVFKWEELAIFPVNVKVEHCAVRLTPFNVRWLSEKGEPVEPEELPQWRLSSLAQLNGLKPGEVRKSVSIEELSVSTLHLPPTGEDICEADSFEILRSTLKRIYDISFKDTVHRGHLHPDLQNGDIIIGEIRLQLTPDDSGRVLKEHNWHEALALITSQQLSYTADGELVDKSRLATITASFTCPLSR